MPRLGIPPLRLKRNGWWGNAACGLSYEGLAWVTGAAATSGWLTRRPGAAGVLTAAAFLVPVSLAYVWLVSKVSGFLAPDLPAAALPGTLLIDPAVPAANSLAGDRTGAGSRTFLTTGDPDDMRRAAELAWGYRIGAVAVV